MRLRIYTGAATQADTIGSRVRIIISRISPEKDYTLVSLLYLWLIPHKSRTALLLHISRRCLTSVVTCGNAMVNGVISEL
jgi:hypothetical protein